MATLFSFHFTARRMTTATHRCTSRAGRDASGSSRRCCQKRAFQRVDRAAKESVNSCDLFNFLRENCVYTISEGELFRLVKFFDNNEDGRLSYTEFEQILLPCEDNCLRRMAQERRAYRVARYENLPLDIERAMAAIFDREIELIRRLDLLKRELEVRYDFSPYAC